MEPDPKKIREDDVTILEGNGAAPPPAGDLIKDTTTQTFVQDVIEESKRQPVLIDFWAPWCGPCRQLTPILEKAVRAAKGKVKLVKMNIDEHPQIPGQMGIQSIPAVIAFAGGRPADGFMGAVPESQVTAFIDKLTKGMPGPASVGDLLKEAEAVIAEGDHATAAQIYAEVLQDDPTNIAALAGLARCYVETGAIDQAKNTLAMIPEAKRNDAAVKAVQAAIELVRAGAIARPGDGAGAEDRGQPGGSPGAVRSRHRAERPGRPPQCGQPSARHCEERPQMERRRRPQTAGAALRSLGRRGRGHGRGAQAPVVDPVFVRPELKA